MVDQLDGVPFEKKHLRKTVRRETKFEDQVVAYAVKRGWKHRKLVSVGKKGWPDRFFWRNGEVRIVEIKGARTPIEAEQEVTIRELRNENVPVFVVRDPDMETVREIFA